MGGLQEAPVTNGMNGVTKVQCEANGEVQDTESRSDPQSAAWKKELALDLRPFMNRAPLTVWFLILW